MLSRHCTTSSSYAVWSSTVDDNACVIMSVAATTCVEHCTVDARSCVKLCTSDSHTADCYTGGNTAVFLIHIRLTTGVDTLQMTTAHATAGRSKCCWTHPVSHCGADISYWQNTSLVNHRVNTVSLSIF